MMMTLPLVREIIYHNHRSLDPVYHITDSLPLLRFLPQSLLQPDYPKPPKQDVPFALARPKPGPSSSNTKRPNQDVMKEPPPPAAASATEDHQAIQHHSQGDDGTLPLWQQALKTAALLVICFNRDDYLDRTLSSILKYHPGDFLLPIIISEDGDHDTMKAVVDKYRQRFEDKGHEVVMLHIHHQQAEHAENGYFLLAAHYKWALNQVIMLGILMLIDLSWLS